MPAANEAPDYTQMPERVKPTILSRPDNALNCVFARFRGRNSLQTPSIAGRAATLAGIIALTACSPLPDPDAADDVMPVIDGEAIEAHVALLADDLYEGREAGKRGYELAAKYVAAQFRTMGLAPGYRDSYFQSMPFRVANIVPGSRALTVSSVGSSGGGGSA